MSRNAIETILGGVVLLVAGGFLAFAYNHSGIRTVDGYTVYAVFDSASGLTSGSDVRIGGIKVGVVSELELDTASYRAKIGLQIRKGTPVPKDSTAAIVGDGLLGGKFVSLEPGGDDAMLQPGDTITLTQSSVSLETLIGKFMFSGGGVDGKGKESSKESSAASPAKP